VGGAAIGHEADFYEDLAKPGLFGGDNHVTRKCVITTNARGVAMNAGDDGLGEGAHCQDGGVRDCPEHCGDIDFSKVAVAEGLKVRAGAKGVSRSSENHDLA